MYAHQLAKHWANPTIKPLSCGYRNTMFCCETFGSQTLTLIIATHQNRPTPFPKHYTVANILRTMTGPSQAPSPKTSKLTTVIPLCQASKWTETGSIHRCPKILKTAAKQGNLEKGSTLRGVCFTYLAVMLYTPRREDEKS